MGSKQRIDFSTFAPPAFLRKLVARCAIVECVVLVSPIMDIIFLGRWMLWINFYTLTPPDVFCISFKMILDGDNGHDFV